MIVVYIFIFLAKHFLAHHISKYAKLEDHRKNVLNNCFEGTKITEKEFWKDTKKIMT